MGALDPFKEVAKKEKRRKPRGCKSEDWVKDETKKLFAEEAPEAWYYMPVQRLEGQHGVPDFVACVPVTITPDMVGKKLALFVGVETKADDTPTRPAQKLCHKALKKARGIVWIIRGEKGIEELRARLRDLVNATR